MKTVTLSRTYTIGSASFDRVSFRAPLLKDYRQIGRVFERQGDVVVLYDTALWGYAERLHDSAGMPPGALGELDLVDALAIETTILGFFLEASAQLHKPASSPSASAGDPATSTG